MVNMFLAGYFTSVALDKLFEQKWGLAVAYGGLVVLNLFFALAQGE